VIDNFGLSLTPQRFMARCSQCNASAYRRLSDAEVAAQLAAGTIPALPDHATVTKFYVCEGCGKVFWKGPKYESARKQMAAVLSLDVAEALPALAPRAPRLHLALLRRLAWR